jgi:hypothetical protein
MLIPAVNASAQMSMNMTRTVTGLNTDGWLVPGTTELTFTESFDLQNRDGAVSAFSVADTLPANWTFKAVTASTPAPNLAPTAGDSGELSFVWFAPIPTFPFTFSYSVTLPGTETGPVTLSGLAKYRTIGNEEDSNTVDTVIQIEPTTIVANQTVAGFDNGFYTPGSQVDVTINLTRTGTEDLTALAFAATLPTGWTFVGNSLTGSQTPNLAPSGGDTGTINFVWFLPIPTFPVTFAYKIAVPATADGNSCMTGQVSFRTNGPGLTSNTVSNCADQIPCLSMTRVVPTQCYNAGGNLTINVSMASACSEGVTALAAQENLPEGWTFVSVTGNPAPNLAPSVGDSGQVQFVWFAPIPAFPYNFSYVVSVPAAQTGTVTYTGETLFRLSGGPKTTGIVSTDICGADLVPPAITLLGDADVTVECGTTYTDAGATATDNRDGDLTASIVVDNPVNAAATGDYTVTYNVKDAAGNAAVEVTRAVHVTDTIAPVITLLGDEEVTMQCGSAYVDAGATANDSCAGDLSQAIAVSGAVNTAVLGDYTLTYNVSDPSNNAAVAVTRVVHVVDTTAPVITLVGNPDVSIQCGSQYVEAGATAFDSCSGDLTANVAISGAVTPAALGDYVITYNVSDTNGNAAATVTRTVHVIDTTAPIITLNGDATVTVECSGTYADAGATANDSCAGDVSANIIATGTVNTAAVGSYTITYNVNDGHGNAATPVTRTVNVVDKTAPVITLNGEAVVTIECGSTYADAGATAHDACAGDLTVVTTGTVNAHATGTYTLTYNVSDPSGNAAAPVTRTVHVADTKAPTITLNGSAAATVECGGTYVDAGANAEDDCQGNLTDSIVKTGEVNTAVAGSYTLTFNVSDAAGNAAAPVTRSVTVSDTVAPVISLLGAAAVTVECKSAYQDAGATATDACDGDLTSKLVVTGAAVDTSAIGSHSVTFDATDTAGNHSQVVRTVHVVDTIKPVIALVGDNPLYVSACAGVYAEPGATATDSCDTHELTVTNDSSTSVNPTTAGTYQVNYYVTDSSGNLATTTRVVVVQACEEGEVGVCSIDSVLIASPVADIVIPSGANTSVTLTSAVTLATGGATNCDLYTQRVTYTLNDVVVGSSEDKANEFPVTTTLVEGAYVLKASAELVEIPDSAKAATFNFAVKSANNHNGYLDNPFADLPNEGDRWLATGAGVHCPRTITMLSWYGSADAAKQAAPVTVDVPRSDDPTQSVTVSVPRGVLAAGEHGILIVGISCDLPSLLGADQASLLSTEPTGKITGAAPFIANIIVSKDGGATFTELDNSILASNPVTIALNGLTFTQGLAKTFFASSTTVETSETTGLSIDVQAGPWSSDSVSNASTNNDLLTAQTTHLSVFEPFEVTPLGPTAEITPSAAYDFIVGIVEPGKSVTNTLTVTNIGGGTLSGQVTLTDAAGVFNLVGSGAYSLATGESAQITVKFTPAKATDYTATLSFSGGASPVTMTVRGSGVATAKTVTIFGCGQGQTSGSPLGDVAVMGVALIGLIALSRRARRSRQS